jgi:hypothetical protein
MAADLAPLPHIFTKFFVSTIFFSFTNLKIIKDFIVYFTSVIPVLYQYYTSIIQDLAPLLNISTNLFFHYFFFFYYFKDYQIFHCVLYQYYTSIIPMECNSFSSADGDGPDGATESSGTFGVTLYNVKNYYY